MANSSFEEKLGSNKFVVTTEVGPPKSVDISEMVHHIELLKDKVDAINITDHQSSVMRFPSLGGALLVKELGGEPVLQMTCRDRNRLALQGDLLAAQALGVANVMVVSGDEITHGDHHQAKPVNDLNLLELLGAIQTLQTGRDLAGVDLKGSPQFLVGATVKVTNDAGALKQELAELDKKIAAGARFFTTQAIFDVAALEKFRKQVGKRKAAIIPTVMLLKSVGMARYINAHMEMKIPEAFVTRIQKSSDRVRECVQIAAEFVAAVKKQGFPGVLVSTVGWEDKLPSILAAAGL